VFFVLPYLANNHLRLDIVSKYWTPRKLAVGTIERKKEMNDREAININWLSLNRALQILIGHAIAQALSRWLPTAAARVRSWVWSSGICGGQSGVGAGFLRVIRFPLPIFIPQIAPQSPSPIIWGWYKRPDVTAVQGTQSHPTSNKRNTNISTEYTLRESNAGSGRGAIFWRLKYDALRLNDPHITELQVVPLFVESNCP
jgi:hypothetical protein